MISTVCLLFFGAFLVWMQTSKRVTWKDRGKIGQFFAQKPLRTKWIASAMMLLGMWLCIWALGVGSGIFAAVVILMTMGCLTVLFFPFRYVGIRCIAGIYIACLLMEIFMT